MMIFHRCLVFQYHCIPLCMCDSYYLSIFVNLRLYLNFDPTDQLFHGPRDFLWKCQLGTGFMSARGYSSRQWSRVQNSVEVTRDRQRHWRQPSGAVSGLFIHFFIFSYFFDFTPGDYEIIPGEENTTGTFWRFKKEKVTETVFVEQLQLYMQQTTFGINNDVYMDAKSLFCI